MTDRDQDKDELFEDLDKFFAPIQDVEWPEPEETIPASEPADTSEPADAAGMDVRPALEEGERSLQVPVAGPAERVGIAFALALAPAVEEENAVAVAGEHPGMWLRALAAGEGDHGCTVARGDVPAGEVESVAGRERDFLVGGAQRGRGHHRARGVREHVRKRDRDNDFETDNE